MKKHTQVDAVRSWTPTRAPARYQVLGFGVLRSVCEGGIFANHLPRPLPTVTSVIFLASSSMLG